MPEGLYESLSPQARDALARAGRPRHFAAGEVIFHQGDPCDSLFLLRSGRAAVQIATRDGEQVTLGLLVAPEEFGEVGLLRADHHHTATVVALAQVGVLSVPAPVFHALRANYPELTEWLLRALGRRLERTSSLLSEALFLDADQRVARRLVECQEAFGPQFPPGLPLRQDDLAAMAGVSRPTANRALRHLAKRGVVRLGRRRIEIIDLAALSNVAQWHES